MEETTKFSVEPNITRAATQLALDFFDDSGAQPLENVRRCCSD
ncbi:hypothetical protein P6U16_25995 (plasmid) [Rhizobium sp. 32-5/1]|nr:hypothetical protein [Rhizobium sp. 32-5/1]WEZ86126.1 hypothetical protein P6U16_25995 [Rhizobium sp. 32-5/1]